jgi:ubiquinone biosynthesis protein
VRIPFLQNVTLPVRVALRAQRIAALASGQGMGGTIGALGIEVTKRGLVFVGVSNRASIRFDSVFGRNLAATFVRLGPTFIKLGQVLASRPDFIGEPVAEELRQLFSGVPPKPFREMKRILHKELGREKVRDAFKSIDPKALACASLGQVHRGVLRDGAPVILKIQKAGAAATVQLDLILIEGLARSFHVFYPGFGILEIFRDFKEATLCEIDYLKEAANIDRFRKNCRATGVRFPKYYKDLSTSKVLVMEPMQGVPVAELKKGSTVARFAAERGLAAVLEQIFDHGFFHADPHAGNLFFQEENGRVGFIDVGLVGQLKAEDKKKFLKVVMAILKRDRSKLAKSLYALGTPGKKANYPKFEAAIDALLDEVQAPEKAGLEKMVNQLLSIARKNHLSIPNRYVMMIRSSLVIEGVARSLDPGISIFQIATPIVARSLFKFYNPFSLFRKR